MIPNDFEYKRAATVAEAIALLGESAGDASLLAGGHSLIPLMKMRLSEPGVLVDISRIPELRGIERRGDCISIGAATTHAELARSEVLLAEAPIVAEAAAEIGDAQVRNRGTIGGSLAHSDPAADLPAVLVALDAQFAVAGPEGTRTVAAEDFFQDFLSVDLRDGEILTEIDFVPTRSAAYAKLVQRASRFALVGVAASLEIDGAHCVSARVAVTGASSHAQRLRGVEAALAGTSLPAAVEVTADAGAELGFVNVDLHGSEEYRRAMVSVFARRAVGAAAARG